ncbi:DUF2179 domain-containing protein [Pseudodesulfovibrio sediminis]|uniref:DUF5698 domain-containing protein n=1 Tax=Pseudodesulfovibrio sediminis TaxID=2810563 RepID=A0ABM7P298_9BACT|nr:DUF5698 domain-containing protein [Pseudodesulfovibrio sediminis]BCS87017.1 hypothetical protein PSDVSF_02590 [Pseudodesulfovibrio sediminis]
MTMDVLFLGILIFLAEVAVLTLGTVRTMVTVLGESKAAFFLGCLEMTLWVFGTAAVMLKVGDEPFLGVCYAVGFAGGNVVGILAEKKLALGNVVVRIISAWKGHSIAEAVRNAGFMITTVAGEGSDGPVTVQFVVCKRKDMKHLLVVAREIDPDLFYTFETAGGASEVLSPSGSRVAKLLGPIKRVVPQM